MVAFPLQTPERDRVGSVVFAQLRSSFLLADRGTVEITGEIADISTSRTRFDLVDTSGILDATTRSIPVICRPETVRGLRVGDVVELRGTFDLLEQDCLLVLRPMRVTKKEQRGRLPAAEQRARIARDPRTRAAARDRLRRRTAPPSRLPVRAAPTGSLRVTFIGPLSDVGQADIKAGLRLDRLEPRWRDVPFHDSQAIADVIRSVSTEDTDLIVVYRGGGEWRDWVALNDVRVVNAVAEAAVPVVTAIGHTTTEAAVAWVADGDFRTPIDVRKALNAHQHVGNPDPHRVRRPRHTARTPGASTKVPSACAAEGPSDPVSTALHPDAHVVTARAEVAAARRALIDAERSFALHRIRVRAVVLGSATATVTILTTVGLRAWMADASWQAGVGSGLGLLIAGSAGTVFLFRGRSRALRPPRRVREGVPPVGGDAWLSALRQASAPRQYRRLHGVADGG
jgi:exodeoxyribonuclease VII large subunit